MSQFQLYKEDRYSKENFYHKNAIVNSFNTQLENNLSPLKNNKK